MSLPTGSRLGPYEIVSAIGAGGMGEVYKARDTRLERTVATGADDFQIGVIEPLFQLRTTGISFRYDFAK